MSNAIPVQPAQAKWWRWQPVTPVQTTVYLAAMALFSGLLTVLLNRLLAAPVDWEHFVSGAVIGLVFNGITLWVKRHPRQPKPASRN